MVSTVYDPDVRELRDRVLELLATDMEDITFKFRDVFRVMERHIDNINGNMYTNFERYIGYINYEEELVDQISTLLMDAFEIVSMQGGPYAEIIVRVNETGHKLANVT